MAKAEKPNATGSKYIQYVVANVEVVPDRILSDDIYTL